MTPKFALFKSKVGPSNGEYKQYRVSLIPWIGEHHCYFIEILNGVVWEAAIPTSNTEEYHKHYKEYYKLNKLAHNQYKRCYGWFDTN